MLTPPSIGIQGGGQQPGGGGGGGGGAAAKVMNVLYKNIIKNTNLMFILAFILKIFCKIKENYSNKQAL